MTRQEPPDEANTGADQPEQNAGRSRSTGAPADHEASDDLPLAQMFAAFADTSTSPEAPTPDPLWPTETATPAPTAERYPDLDATPRQQDARVVAPWLFTPPAPDPLDATTQPAEFAPTEKAPAVAIPAERPSPYLSPTQPPAGAEQFAAPQADEPTQIIPPAIHRSAGPIEEPEELRKPETLGGDADGEQPNFSAPLIATPAAPAPAAPPPAKPEAPRQQRAPEPPPMRDQRKAGYATPAIQPYAHPRPTEPPRQASAQVRQAPPQARPSAPPAPVAQTAAPVRPAPAPLPARRRGGGLLLGAPLIALIVLALVGAIGYGVYTTAQAERPYEAAQVFCADLRSQSYTSAYALLSTRYQATISQKLFVLANQLHDQLNGVINSCSVTSPSNIGFTYHVPTSANITTVIVRNQQLHGSLTLVQQGSGWRVDQIATTLQGTDVGPLLTQATFCGAVMAGNYALAYAQLAPGAQAAGSEHDFALAYAHAFSGANGGLKLTLCQPDLTSYKVGVRYGKVSVSFVTQDTGQQITFPTVFNFALLNGAWKIASLTTSVTPQA